MKSKKRQEIRSVARPLTLAKLLAELNKFDRLSVSKKSFQKAKETAPDLLRQLQLGGV